jgi:hypothetical protein
MFIYSVSIEHSDLKFLIGAGGQWLKKTPKMLQYAVNGQQMFPKCSNWSKNAPKVMLIIGKSCDSAVDC